MSQHSIKDREYRRIVAEEKAKCKATNGKCWICHQPIDCTLEPGDAMSFTLDHVGEGGAQGPDTHRRSKLKWAHRRCNSRRGDGTNTRTLITSRKW